MDGVGKRIKAVRLEKQISRTELARRIKTTYTTLQMVEAGKFPPSWHFIERAAKALGVEQFEFIDPKMQKTINDKFEEIRELKEVDVDAARAEALAFVQTVRALARAMLR